MPVGYEDTLGVASIKAKVKNGKQSREVQRLAHPRPGRYNRFLLPSARADSPQVRREA